MKKKTADWFVRALACFGLFYISGWAPKAADESVWTVIAEVLHSDCLNSKQCLDTQCTRQMAQLPVYKVNSKIETLKLGLLCSITTAKESRLHKTFNPRDDRHLHLTWTQQLLLKPGVTAPYLIMSFLILTEREVL